MVIIVLKLYSRATIENVLLIEQININDKIRVLALYCIYRNGIIGGRFTKLLNFMEIDYQHLPLLTLSSLSKF